MFQKIAKHRANDASNDVHRPPLLPGGGEEGARVKHLADTFNFSHGGKVLALK